MVKDGPMTSEPQPAPNLEERLQTVREGVRLMAQAARPGLAESLKIARDALHTLDSFAGGHILTRTAVLL